MKKEYDFSKAKRGPVISVPKGKTRITIRLDDDILTSGSALKSMLRVAVQSG